MKLNLKLAIKILTRDFLDFKNNPKLNYQKNLKFKYLKTLKYYYKFRFIFKPIENFFKKNIIKT